MLILEKIFCNKDEKHKLLIERRRGLLDRVKKAENAKEIYLIVEEATASELENIISKVAKKTYQEHVNQRKWILATAYGLLAIFLNILHAIFIGSFGIKSGMLFVVIGCVVFIYVKHSFIKKKEFGDEVKSRISIVGVMFANRISLNIKRMMESGIFKNSNFQMQLVEDILSEIHGMSKSESEKKIEKRLREHNFDFDKNSEDFKAFLEVFSHCRNKVYDLMLSITEKNSSLKKEIEKKLLEKYKNQDGSLKIISTLEMGFICIFIAMLISAILTTYYVLLFFFHYFICFIFCNTKLSKRIYVMLRDIFI